MSAKPITSFIDHHYRHFNAAALRDAAIGSGAMYAQAAALALKKHAPHLTARQMVEDALHIAADICIYTNHNLIIAEPA